MRQEPLIVAHGKIRARVTAAGFLSRKARREQYLGQIEHVFRLQRPHQIGVVDAALVLDGDSLEALLQFGNAGEALLHGFAGAEDARVFVHEGSQLAADLRRALGSLLLQQASEYAAFFFAELGFRNTAQRRRRFEIFRDSAACDAAPDQTLRGGIAPQAVGAVHGMACHLAGGPDILDLRSAVDVGFDAAHGVVSYRPDGDQLGDGIDAQKLHADFADQGQALVDPLRAQVGQIEMDIVEAIGSRENPALRGFPSSPNGIRYRGAPAPSSWARTSP